MEVTKREPVKAVVMVPDKVGSEIVGPVAKTKLPEPTSSVMELSRTNEVAEEVKAEEPLVNTAREAVKPERVIVPLEEIPVAPEIAPAPLMSIVGVFKKLSQFAPILIAASVESKLADRASIFIA